MHLVKPLKVNRVWDQVHSKVYRVAPAEEITHHMIDATIKGIKSNSMINKQPSRKRIISQEHVSAYIKVHIAQHRTVFTHTQTKIPRGS